ncbi:cAMP-specific 3',5'-cyclic phosphodiesterase 4C isoform X6 [Meriones unguiculatus]|uniref:cAMP-specific 3',5'-cyclic phosphodiesterase 4C isoform X6 n=1 Tax=Meriones unguiculatus TaxID=10047 RepID=UPI00293F1973|nr:cAMP-specific 3',5'-cyclic phosphodiesterase 4C isoform X6 [Meriones unguiculatus]
MDTRLVGRAGSPRPPKHLWRQPRRPIRIQRCFHSDPECSEQPGLLTSRRSWPSSFQGCFDLENGLRSGRAPLDPQPGPGLGRALQAPAQHGQRRESFLYRSDSDHESPKAVSRTSSAASDLHGEDMIVTPFAQVGVPRLPRARRGSWPPPTAEHRLCHRSWPVSGRSAATWPPLRLARAAQPGAPRDPSGQQPARRPRRGRRAAAGAGDAGGAGLVPGAAGDAADAALGGRDGVQQVQAHAQSRADTPVGKRPLRKPGVRVHRANLPRPAGRGGASGAAQGGRPARVPDHRAARARPRRRPRSRRASLRGPDRPGGAAGQGARGHQQVGTRRVQSGRAEREPAPHSHHIQRPPGAAPARDVPDPRGHAAEVPAHAGGALPRRRGLPQQPARGRRGAVRARAAGHTRSAVFTDLEVLAALFACAIHDVDHPGVSNQFLINTHSELALMYNDMSVLENHHLAVGFKLLQAENCDIFRNLSAKQRLSLRRMVIDMVLATDMSKHMSLLADLKTMVETKKVTSLGVLLLDNYSDRIQVLQSLVHCADLSNPAKPLPLYRRWTERIMAELFRQGDRERAAGLDVSPMCDKHTASVEKSQVGFIDYIAHPLWETWADLVHPDAQELLYTLEDNREWYQRRVPRSPALAVGPGSLQSELTLEEEQEEQEEQEHSAPNRDSSESTST